MDDSNAPASSLPGVLPVDEDVLSAAVPPMRALDSRFIVPVREEDDHLFLLSTGISGAASGTGPHMDLTAGSCRLLRLLPQRELGASAISRIDAYLRPTYCIGDERDLPTVRDRAHLKALTGQEVTCGERSGRT